MKRKNTIVSILLAAVVVTSAFCGCQKKSDTEEGRATVNSPADAVTNTTAPTIEAPAKPTATPSPDKNRYTTADEFIINDNSDGTQVLRLYRSENAVIRLPETYNGRPYILGNAVFCGNEGIEEIYFHDNAGYVTAMMLWDCINLKKVDLGPSVKSIGAYAFCHCEKLEELILSDCLEQLDAFFLRGTTALKSIYIPPSVEDIDPRAFIGANEDLIIYGKFGSPIHYFAIANKLIFIAK